MVLSENPRDAGKRAGSVRRDGHLARSGRLARVAACGRRRVWVASLNVPGWIQGPLAFAPRISDAGILSRRASAAGECRLRENARTLLGAGTTSWATHRDNGRA